jgi:hypothetical protein
MPSRFSGVALGSLVYCEWDDSASSDEWAPLERIRRANVPVRATSVGWLFARDRTALTIVPHLVGTRESEPDAGCGDMVIPLGCIVRLVKLKPPAGVKPLP